MTKQKSKTGSDDEPRARGESGPPSATENEKGEGHPHGDDADRGIPKVSKHDANKSDLWGGGLH
ncbi:MAG TPA: hypothetical protein VFA21_13195 [Pyrinomonadaceae bacterium]|jgi:hypothetical protein|nr:hypothetical protein [Pyrinomonadaceae bacterium]